MSAPEILTPEMCFAASVNAAAVEAIREWCDARVDVIERDACCERCDARTETWAEAVEAVRALLPALAVEGAECETASTSDP